MTRADPSTYYTPAPILALCEPQAGSGMFLCDMPPFDPSPPSADAIRPTVTGLTIPAARGNASADGGAGSHGHPPPDLACERESRAGVPVAAARPAAVAGAVTANGGRPC